MSEAVGSMPVGRGPVGGVTGSDFVSPTLIGITPLPGSTGVVPLTPIEFDVIDFEGRLDTSAWLRVKVNGTFIFDIAGIPQFLNGWSGSVTVVPLGLHLRLVPPVAEEPLSSPSVQVTARDLDGNQMRKAWSYTILGGLSVNTITQVGNRCLDVTFTGGLIVNAAMFRPSNYAVLIRLGYAVPAYVKTITPSSLVLGTVISSMRICMRAPMTRNGRYSLRINNLTDAFGTVLEEIT